MFNKVLAVSTLFIAVIFIAHTPQAEALSCVQPESNSIFIQNGGVIFHGVVESNNAVAVTGTGAQTRDVTFSVKRAWGDTRIASPFTVRDNIPAGTDLNDVWGFRATFNVGQQYTVHAIKDGEMYVADIGACARSSTGYQDIAGDLGVGYIPNETISDQGDSFTNSLLKQIQELLATVSRLQEQLRQQTGGSTVIDFKSCVAKTGVVLESYPRQCVYNGQTYVEIIQSPVTPPPFACPVFNQNLSIGTRGSDVSALQQFLKSAGTYTYPVITGYYGSATQQAVERWQAQNGVVSFGTPNTTGYGVVGPATRNAIKRICGGVTPEPVACTLEYAPVCGYSNGGQKTYGNSCQLKADGAQYQYEGECRSDQSTTAPNSCKIWNDGCNTCSRTYPGGPMACTLRACIWQGIPKCEQYFDDVPTGTSPVVHSFSGPTALSINETGVWEVNASDPQNGSLRYKVDWGENAFRSAFDSIAALANSGFVQNTTFTHSYSFAGTYTVTIIVRDDQGLEAKTTSTVRVGGAETQSGFTIQPSIGSAPLTVTATITLEPRPSFDLIEVCGPIGVGTITWGDGTTSNPTRLGCSSQRVITVSHTYQQGGSYNAVFKNNNGTQYTRTVTVNGFGPTLGQFSAAPTSGTAPLIVWFTAPGGSSCVDGPDYQIDYGDGTQEMTPSCSQGVQTMQHTYTDSGTYTAVLYSIPSGFGPAPVDRTPRTVSSETIYVGSNVTSPWRQTCTSGTSYGGGFYESCN